MNGLCESKFIHCKYVKYIWDKLQNIYEGHSKVTSIKLQTYRGHFERLKMKEDENNATYFL
jgi:hypothetical protein